MPSVARLCPDHSFLSLCHRRCVAGLSMLYKVNSNSNDCLFSELPSASTRVRHTRPAATHSLKFEVSRCRMSKFARCFLPAQVRIRHELPYTVFDTGRLDGFKGTVNQYVFFSFPWRRCLWGCEAIYKQLCFSHLGLCCWF